MLLRRLMNGRIILLSSEFRHWRRKAELVKQEILLHYSYLRCQICHLHHRQHHRYYALLG